MLLLFLACTPVIIDLGDGPDGNSELAGGYAGSVVGRYVWEGGDTGSGAGELPCGGDFAVTLSDAGNLTGSATCRSASSSYPFAGPLAGTVEAGLVTGTWTVLFAWNEIPIALEGDVGDGVLSIRVDGDLGAGHHFDGEMSGRF